MFSDSLIWSYMKPKLTLNYFFGFFFLVVEYELINNNNTQLNKILK